jgi:hypothetical protein
MLSSRSFCFTGSVADLASSLGLDQHSESLIQIVKRILDEQTEQNREAELCGLGLPLLPGKGEL